MLYINIKLIHIFKRTELNSYEILKDNILYHVRVEKKLIGIKGQQIYYNSECMILTYFVKGYYR